MSEKLYSFLLRLYPARFRRQYADEAMQVFRDRLRDERGVLKRVRLWLDVLLDVGVSAPRERRRAASAPAPSPSGFPSFLVLENEPPRPDRFLLGTVLASVALGTFGFLLTHGGNQVRFPAVSNLPLRSAMPPAASGNQTNESLASRSGADAAEILSDAERRLVIRKVIDAVQQYDGYAAESQSVTELLEEHESRGEYDGIRDGSLFAALLTQQIKGVTRHVTVTVMCGRQPASGNQLWAAPSRPGTSIFRRIDDHFSVALAPVVGSTNGALSDPALHRTDRTDASASKGY